MYVSKTPAASFEMCIRDRDEGDVAGDHHRGDERKKQNVPAAELQPRERICRERGDRDHANRHRDGQKHGIDHKLIKGQHLEQALVVLHRERPGPCLLYTSRCV